MPNAATAEDVVLKAAAALGNSRAQQLLPAASASPAAEEEVAVLAEDLSRFAAGDAPNASGGEAPSAGAGGAASVSNPSNAPLTTAACHPGQDGAGTSERQTTLGQRASPVRQSIGSVGHAAYGGAPDGAGELGDVVAFERCAEVRERGRQQRARRRALRLVALDARHGGGEELQLRLAQQLHVLGVPA